MCVWCVQLNKYTDMHVYLRKKYYLYIKYLYKSIYSIYMKIFLKYIQACLYCI